jgi:superfamily II DNA or RNA helicase
MTYKTGNKVEHVRFGLGTIQVTSDSTAIVRFEHGIEEVLISELELVRTISDAISEQAWASPLHVLCLGLSSAIVSVNDTWGLFSRSRITLLPHQLWVCRKVISDWPARWLIADDVGLGKTIESGLILWPLLSRERVKRLLIICPSSLVEQWQQRLRDMFDIRVAKYTVDSDTSKSDFWNSTNAVVASMQTLRADNKNRHKRMLESEAWDLVIVDEAHHLNADESRGPTLGYQLLHKLETNGKIVSMLFFTGTPHRGKDYGFLSLLKLLRSDLFNPKEPMYNQLKNLSSTVIRNNKQNVTDLSGKKLFKPQVVIPKTFRYTEEETNFYDLLTEFITSGKTYASSLDQSNQRLVMLVLICMQKLASSSIAAIRRALENRLKNIKELDDKLNQRRKRNENLDSNQDSDGYDEDEQSAQEEKLASEAILNLLKDEEKWLKLLISSADKVQSETKIELIGEVLEHEYKDRSVLLFTEYKATQSKVINLLIKRYGKDLVVFINGDEMLEDLDYGDGVKRTVRITRGEAADRFNEGTARFLVSTEAAGEGIDLQENCHSMIHIDLPWNPMRLHQRVGRLNRYGQKEQVEVITLRNPDTVEARIWDKLNTKIESIMMAFSNFMDDPEDLYSLILGMTPQSMFTNLFSGTGSVTKDNFSKWFDDKTATFGGEDVIDTVKQLFGNCAKFDYQQAKLDIPRLDLPNIKPFFESMLVFNRKRSKVNDDGSISFKTPDEWKNAFGVQKEYNDIVFERNGDVKRKLEKIFGIGHVVVDKAIIQALNIKDSICVISQSDLSAPLYLLKARDRITSTGESIRFLVFGITKDSIGWNILRDWELIKILNPLVSKYQLHRKEYTITEYDDILISSMKAAIEYFRGTIYYTQLPFRVADVESLVVLVPGIE